MSQGLHGLDESLRSSDSSMMLPLQMSLLRVRNGYPVSVGDIVATVEDEPTVGKILMVRFFEGPGSGMDRLDWTVLVLQARQRAFCLWHGLPVCIALASLKMNVASKHHPRRSTVPW